MSAQIGTVQCRLLFFRRMIILLTRSQKYCIIAFGCRGVAQFGRVLGLGPRCRRFKSCHLDQRKRVIHIMDGSFFIYRT